MRGESEANHSAIAASIEGSLTPAQRQEFEAHLATCLDCQAEVAALRTLPKAETGTPARRIWPVVIGAVLVLVLGYALGWWAWDLAHR
jgi:anti-sigma factor RsiW